MQKDLTQALLEALESGRRGALATVIRTSGSAPQEPGARLLLTGDDVTVGTVGGGAIEHAVLEALKSCRSTGKPTLLSYELTRDLGMCCGGHMEVFVEPVESVQRLLLFGAGHVAMPTAALARTVGFDVTVIDDREELNTETRFPGCQRILAEPSEAASRVAPRPEDWLLIVTHDHRLDEQALDTFARLPHRYIGMIGSRRKVFRVIQRIAQRRELPVLERVYAPVGLDIGAVTPEEIAVSIVGELVALRHEHASPHMSVVHDPALARVLAGDLAPEAGAAVADPSAR
ncbi:MAG: XdhC family protein [Myxococcales bacterium]|nr:XdhC family protein [Myxococcales bacterium]MCB9579412.1 XdhC family protein [Polyangiaceae bacterium]